MSEIKHGNLPSKQQNIQNMYVTNIQNMYVTNIQNMYVTNNTPKTPNDKSHDDVFPSLSLFIQILRNFAVNLMTALIDCLDL